MMMMMMVGMKTMVDRGFSAPTAVLLLALGIGFIVTVGCRGSVSGPRRGKRASEIL